MAEHLPGYFLPDGYVSREAPSYFADAPSSLVWQPDVYREAAEIARRLDVSRIVDLGCGEARKLVALHPEFELIGVDFGANVQACRERYPFATWIDHDLDADQPLPLSPEQLERSVIICSDIIEHLLHPERLLENLRATLGSALVVLFTTPERDLTWGPGHRGPPPNPCHIREWTRTEFARLLKAAGFEHVEVGLTRASDQDELLRTILALCFPSRRVQARASRPRSIRV